MALIVWTIAAEMEHAWKVKNYKKKNFFKLIQNYKFIQDPDCTLGKNCDYIGIIGINFAFI